MIQLAATAGSSRAESTATLKGAISLMRRALIELDDGERNTGAVDASSAAMGRQASRICFDLTLLLLQIGDTEAACVHWLEARGWPLDCQPHFYHQLLCTTATRQCAGAGATRQQGGTVTAGFGGALCVLIVEAGQSIPPPSDLQQAALDELILSRWAAEFRGDRACIVEAQSQSRRVTALNAE